MMILLTRLTYFFLLLQVSCSSLKRSREEETSALAVEDASKSKKPKLASPDVFTTTKVTEKVNDDYILSRIFEFSPEAQVNIRTVSTSGRYFIDENAPYQRSLGLNLNISGFSKLPLHGDLKLFENVSFPKTSEGKMDALLFLMGMSRFALKNSPINDALLGIIYDEFADLAANNPTTFQIFLATVNIGQTEDNQRLFMHFIKTRNPGALVVLKQACPSLWSKSDKTYKGLSDPELFESVAVLSAHFSAKPDDFNVLFPNYLSVFTVICLFSSNLPKETVNQLLVQNMTAHNPETFTFLIISLLCVNSDSLIPNLGSFRNRLMNFLHFVQEHRLRDTGRVFDDVCKMVESMKLLTKCRFEGFFPSQVQLEDDTVYDHALLHNFLPLILIASKRFDLALQHLPSFDFKPLLDVISKNPVFISLLERENPEWIRKHYMNNQEFTFKNFEVHFAFQQVSRLDDLYSFATQGDLLKLSALVYSKSSLEEVKNFVKHVDIRVLPTHFELLVKQNICAERFIAILKFFIAACEFHRVVPGHVPRFALSAERIIAILEHLDERMLRLLLSNPFNVEITLGSDVFLKILHSDVLRAKLFAHRKTAFLLFSADLVQASYAPLSPVEIYYSSLFFEKPRTRYIIDLLRSRHKKFIADEVNFFRHSIPLIALSRALYSACPEVANFSGAVHLHRLFAQNYGMGSDFLASVYSGMTKRGKAALEKVVAEAFLMVPGILEEIAHAQQENEHDDDDDDDDDDVEDSHEEEENEGNEDESAQN